MASKRLPIETVRAMVRMYDAGASTREVAEAFYVSNNTAWRYLKEHTKLRSVGGNQRPELHEDDDRVSRCVELYMRGFSTNEIGAKLGISHTTVSYRLRKAGVPIRHRTESLRIRWKEKDAA